MKKRFLISVIALMLIVAMAAGFTAAQQEKMNKVQWNYITIGDPGAVCTPSPLVQQGAMSIDTPNYHFVGTLTTGTIYSDLYLGLCDEDGQGPGKLGQLVEYKLSVDDIGIVESWKAVDDAFSHWKKVADDVPPGKNMKIEIWLRLKPTGDFSQVLGVTHWFQILLFGVNQSGIPPSEPGNAPWTYAKWNNP